MSTLSSHALALVSGALLGAAFFHGLWITIDGLPASKRPALRMLVSLLFRFALAGGLVYVLSRYGQWSHLVAAAIGFAVLRTLYLQRITDRFVDREHVA